METVLISGASSATSEALAEELLGRGLRVCLVSRRGTLPAAPAVQRAGDRVSAHAVDLTDPDATAALHAALLASGTTVSHLVHLVGGWAGGTGIAGQSDEKYRLLAGSFDSLRVVSREFLPDLISTGGPRILTVSSPLAQAPTASSANYAAVKAATEAWTLALDAALRAETTEGAASIIVTDGLAGREAGFASLAADVLQAPAARVRGRRIAHV
ncbi:SDR family oxidoreductase [Leucobacter rhizosphaerae]|uniref:SDR family oxidoreductase n=1 Tax=Leucobacter rhizosphaerae TaxID=2932245 RepID=A0ABY4FTF3_9MICO|nr:SDR family oxidoreductase [Leucobacter rhizosphaerae]UOQ59567.1 SDR family oxidoreductase [Leucobacter rhizosphaerae]